MVKDAEVPPPNTIPPDPMAPDSSTKEGRGSLLDWLTYGFITPTFSRAASRAVDYAYNDFGLYQVATGLGKVDDAAIYLNRSRNWRNHWNPNLESIGYSGFIVPRTVSDFVSTDPLTDAGYWGDPYYEASSWEYSWGDIHDVAKLVEWMGGADTFFSRLETMFTVGANPNNLGGIIFDSTNEPYVSNCFAKTLANSIGHSTCHTSTTSSTARIAQSTSPKRWLKEIIILVSQVCQETAMLEPCKHFSSGI
jgi:putative alpha-1,2-mannosidase